MAIKNKTPVYMKCTQEQFDRDLKKPLLNLGYKFDDLKFINSVRILLSRSSQRGVISTTNVSCWGSKKYHHIDSYNPELFLALAAMTEGEDWIVGEYLVFDYIKIFKCKKIETGAANSHSGIVCQTKKHLYRKATVEELVDHFSGKKDKTKSDIYTVDIDPYDKSKSTQTRSLTLEECFPKKKIQLTKLKSKEKSEKVKSNVVDIKPISSKLRKKNRLRKF